VTARKINPSTRCLLIGTPRAYFRAESISDRKGTPIIKKSNPSLFIKGGIKKKEKNKSLDIEQIYGHGSQGGLMPGVTVLAGCRQ
jgi:hypothetical protein